MATETTGAGFTTWQDLETVRLERDGGAVKIVLNRPKTLNAWILQMGTDLQAAVKACEADDVRAVLVTGEGRAFSSGADLTQDSGLRSSEALNGYYNDVMLGIRALPKPVVSAVRGPAAGVGCALALSCDLVMMAESSFLLLAFVNIGLVPDGGASAFVPARAGGGRALEMALLGERVGAAKALDWGLANRVVADDDLTTESEALLRRLADGPTRAYAGIKRELNAQLYPDLAKQLRLEAEIQDEAEASADFAEGVAAFLEKRSPKFTGA
ncbi:MAG: 2-(1,2-epoxy,2-dihydrophenyl)acetyl-CoA isomerase [Baekduia sp.]|jgi:2-(1,2-epoxy-1,2-dihydrophenyl)acetyl-CoA isomerase|nr:2-(1,2-epoxy,2-dihydrophenyl)acetyl-CoA isomerase [Baekduia sp.]